MGVVPPLFGMQRKEERACTTKESGRVPVWARSHHDSGGAPSPPPPQVSFSFKSVFVKWMQADFCLTVKPSAMPGDALTI